MDFLLASDYWWETKINLTTDRIYRLGFADFLAKQDYGTSLSAITVILFCRDLPLKQRIKFSKKEKGIYIDIILDFDQFMRIEQKEKDRIVAENLISEIPRVIAKYKFEDFDLPRFEMDLKKWMKKIG